MLGIIAYYYRFLYIRALILGERYLILMSYAVPP